MQKLLFLLVMSGALYACGGTGSKTQADGGNDATGLSTECTEFLDGYDKYVDDYIMLLKDYKSNPTDISLMERATKMASEANAWGNKSPDCKDASEFLSRQAKIQAKLAKASLAL